MLRLTPQRENRWIELTDLGVRIEIRPLTTPVLVAARAEAGKRILALRAEAEDQAKAGFPPDPLGPNFANVNWRSGLSQQFVAEALLRFAAVAWEGVADADGAPLPLDAASIQAFAEHEAAATAFLEAALAPLDALSAEGNGSAPSSAGAGGSGATTAPDAATEAAPPVLLS